MNKHHQIEDVEIEGGTISLTIDGNRIQRNLGDLSDLLARAKKEELKEFEVSPSGYGIH